MPRLYLDTNIISYLHHPDHYPNAIWLNSLLKVKSHLGKSNSNTIVVYSPAHLMDVRKGFKKSERHALEKLQFISELTHSRCIVKNDDSYDVRFEHREAVEFFSRGIDSFGDFLDKTKGIDLMKVVEHSTTFQKYKDIVLDNPDLWLVLNQLPINFVRTKENGTLFSLMCDFANSYDDLCSNGHLLYRMLREKARMDTGIGNSLDDEDDPLTTLDEVLQKSDTGKFINLVMIRSFRSDLRNRQDIVGSLFMNLDLFGYKQDKLNSRHGYTSVTTDADHSFYASYCDFFVTEDERTAAKAVAVYKYLKLDTKVKNIEELLVAISSSNL